MEEKHQTAHPVASSGHLTRAPSLISCLPMSSWASSSGSTIMSLQPARHALKDAWHGEVLVRLDFRENVFRPRSNPIREAVYASGNIRSPSKADMDLC
jgi:hypothetical protein